MGVHKDERGLFMMREGVKNMREVVLKREDCFCA